MRKNIVGWLSRLALVGILTVCATEVFAQCNGQFLKNTFCGYAGPNTQGLPAPFTITPGVLNPIAGGTVIGNPTNATANPVATAAPVLGIPGTSTGQVGFAGSGSGTATVKAQAAAGSPTLLLPTTSGTFPSTVSAPLALNTTTGQLSITGAAGQVLAGATPAFTSTPTLGASGTLGSVTFGNASSGLVTLQPVAGALGTVTVSLPAASGTTAVSATSPLVLGATSGNLTCPTCATSLTPSGAALTTSNDTNVTLTTGGSPTNALLNAASITAGWTGQLSLTRGGTNASLTASNGGLVYSTGSALAILSGTATANQIPLSGSSAAPSWSTATYPSTAAAGTVLAAGTANTISGTSTPTLGASGTLGSVTFGNASSGLVTLQTVTGALGSQTLSLPAATDTLVGKATTDTFTNKTYDTAGTGNVFRINGNGISAVTGTGNTVALQNSAALTTPNVGVATATSINKMAITAPATSSTLAVADGKTLTASNTLTFTGTDGSSVAFGTGGTAAYTIASGTLALATGAISSATCTSAQTASATGTATTDAIIATFNADPTAVTGYVPLTTGMLTIILYPTANTVNAKVCNNTTSSITPGAVTLNWRVVR